MELKVWCDGIQRIVCGATSATTCQDVVFALAHATGQTGRFILVEKWKNNERVLAPADRPVMSLAKWGEYANEVSFVMKKSGDVVAGGRTPPSSKKSDSDLVLQTQKRQKVNNHQQQVGNKPNAEPVSTTTSSFPISKSMPAICNNEQTRKMGTNNADHYPRAHHESLSRSSPHAPTPIRLMNYGTAIGAASHHHHLPPPNQGYSLSIEPLYGTVVPRQNRPRQPPPYQEAIAKSSLVNIINTPPPPPPTAPTKTAIIHHQQQRSSPTMSSHHHQASFHHNHHHQQQKTMGLISQQQETLKKQEKSIADIKKEIDLVQRKLLTSNDMAAANRYRDELDCLRQMWMEQESMIEQLESENMEQELAELLDDGQRYETEMKQVKTKLTHCETEIAKRRDEMCQLMKRIQEHLNGSSPAAAVTGDDNDLERLKASIQDKTARIENQKMDLEVLEESLEHFDKNIETKNAIIDQLVGQIKEANVEGLTLQRSAMIVPTDEPDSAEKQSPPPAPPATPKSPSNGGGNGAGVTNRKIPVSLHELGNTVPTKKNPDGIWV